MDNIEREALKIITNFESHAIKHNPKTTIRPCPRCGAIHYLELNDEGLCANCGYGGHLGNLKSEAAFLMSDSNNCMIIGIKHLGNMEDIIDDVSAFTYKMFHKHPYKLDNFILAYYKDNVKHIDAKYIV